MEDHTSQISDRIVCPRRLEGVARFERGSISIAGVMIANCALARRLR